MNNEKDILNNLPPFYPGQSVVALETVGCSGAKKGDIFKAIRCFKMCCHWVVDIGLPIPINHSEETMCVCGSLTYTGKTWPLRTKWFAPLQSQSFPLLTLSKVIEEQHELVSSNSNRQTMNNEKDILNNLPDMHIGQRAICVEPYEYYGLFKDKEYTITDAVRCSCGQTYVAYGFPSDNSNTDCPKCGKFVKEGLKQAYCYSNRFRQIQSQSFPLLTLTKVIEEQHELVSSN